MPDIDREARFRRNKAAFEEHFPGVWETLAKLEGKVSRVVWDGDQAINIDLGEMPFYSERAPDWTATQVATYFGNPDRISFEDPAHCNLSDVSVDLFREIGKYMVGQEADAAASLPVVDSGYAFVFGVGLGYHVAEFVKRKAVRNLVLIEPVQEFLLHSMHAIDWAQIISDARENDIALHFIGGADPAWIVRSIEALLQRYGATFLDGSYAYVHYHSWALREARQQLNEKIKVYFLSAGFFEDEILMMRNTYGNFRRFPFHLVERRQRLEQQMPVFIVGSGPSLDRDLPFVKKWRDRAILVSCGTSIGILLKNGLRPDLHIENENTLPLVNNLRKFKEQYGLQGIRLVSTTTLRPEASELFDKRWHYFRAPLSPTVLFSSVTKALPFADPLVANAGSSVVAHLGFQNIYLFGVDCGRPIGGQHHSKDAVYYQDGYKVGVDIDAGFTREVPGNFGGRVLTDWSLDISRRTFTSLMESRGLTFINCSHGAKIDGARPKVAAAIQLTNPPGQQEAVLRGLEERMQSFEAGGYLTAVDFQPHVDAYDDFVREFDAVIEAARKEDDGFWEFEQRIERFWYGDWSDHKAILSIIGGSFTSMVRLGAFGGTRLRKPDARQEFFHLFLDKYRELCLWMADETRTLLSEMAEGREELSDIGKRPRPPEDGCDVPAAAETC